MAEGSKVSVVMVTHHSADAPARAVASLRAAEPERPLEVIIVDNASSPTARAKLAAIPDVTLLANADNLGFGRACNQGAAVASGEFVLFLNPDVVAQPGALSRLLAAAAAHPEAAIVAPVLLNEDGSPQHSARGFYRWSTVLLRRTPLGRLLPNSRAVRDHLLLDWDQQGEREVDWVIGACLLVGRRDFLRSGGFDDRFFLYFEDVDLCLRAWRAGRSVRCIGAARFVHEHRRQSAGWRPSRAKWLHARSMLAFIGKYGGWPRRYQPQQGVPVVFVNEGKGALGERASRFAGALGGVVLAKDAVDGGRCQRVVRAAWAIVRARPRRLHVIDVGAAGLVAQLAGRLVGAEVTLDTGDEYYALMRRTAEFAGLRLEVAGIVERLALDCADRIAARGRGHVASLRDRGYNDVYWLPDGVDPAAYRAALPHPWRARVGWGEPLVVASVGSLLVDRRYGWTQGLELIDALPDAPKIRAAIVGDGPGRLLLEARARELAVADRVAFLGRVPPSELAAYLKTFDMCLWTQSNDVVGQARTTGKLPLLMASGRFVLASRVGEAIRVLPEPMLIDYHGEFDAAYPRRLAERIREVDADRSRLGLGARLPAIAAELYDYRLLERRLQAAMTGSGSGVSA